MKFLLVGINAKYIHSNPALYSLKAAAGEEWGSCVELAEYTVNSRSGDILRDIFERKPDVIGFSCYIWNFCLVRELLPDLSKVLPGTDIWLGGPEVSFDCGRLLREFPMVRGIMVGEGELTFRELLSCYGEGKGLLREAFEGRLKEIAGLYLRTGYTKDREPACLDELPFYYDSLDSFENRIIYYESARGCPFCCAYCLSAVDRSLRFRSVEKVKKELQFFLDRKVPQVKFVDRTFNCNHDHAMEIWRFIREHDNGVTNFHFEIGAELLCEEEFSLLSEMRPGLLQFEIGVQSVKEDTLRAVNRPARTQSIAKAVSRLRAGGNIHIHLDLIAGLPLEDFESFVRSFNRVYAMEPEQLQLGFLKLLKGTPLAEKAGEYGIVCKELPPYEVLYTNWLSFEDILRLKRVEEMVEVYYNSRQFTRTLSLLAGAFESPFFLFSELADYYERRGFGTKAPARAAGYEILLGFAAETAPEDKELYRELLTFDYFLRENPKSRPGFMADVSDFRERTRQLEREHGKQAMKMLHVEPFFYPVWEEGMGKGGKRKMIRSREPGFVLFDYHKRDALTNNVSFCLISPRDSDEGA